MNTIDLLQELTSVSGVSGVENNIVEKLKKILAPYGKVSVDSLNNVCCKTAGNGPKILLDAHIDEIGFVVKEITSDGFIKVSNVGGVDRRMLLGCEVSVWGDTEYRGVISTLPPHLQKKDDERSAPEIDDVSIDVGMSKEHAEKAISLGDRVTLKHNFARLLGNQVTAGALDDRSGVVAIILALDLLKNENADITALFSSQEEVGTRGAKAGCYGKNVDEAIVIDVSFGYSPMCKKSDCGEIGKGPMIGISPILDRNMSKAMIDIAQKNNIQHQIEVMGGGNTGTNADVITVNQQGIKTALISIPEKYMHSPIEVVDITDVENTARLIAGYVKERMVNFNA